MGTMQETPMNADAPTICAISFLLAILANVLHEGLGRGITLHRHSLELARLSGRVQATDPTM
jgi:hypothetical protein